MKVTSKTLGLSRQAGSNSKGTTGNSSMDWEEFLIIACIADMAISKLVLPAALGP